MTRKIYAIGNAHLDPVWMWRWQEGSAEAKATIRSALDRMKEYPEFKFVCSSASVYKWIEEFDPDMFKEIQARVKEGRFIIVGGWFVQPDCNIPSGEGFARQSLYNQRYFFKKFGKTAKVGYNVDSFGHNYMLPQILKKSGMDQYIFMRPAPKENKLDGMDLFRWYSPDGSNVLTLRIRDPYCFNFNTAMERDLRIKFLRSEMEKQGVDDILFMYGVGNHGGGPTKKNIELLLEYNKKNPGEVIFADPKEFFDEMRKREYIPVWRDDLQHHASGCYSAVSAIKAHNRKAENALIEAEMYSFAGHIWLGRKCPNAKLEEAWEGVCFNHFHDIMGGCAIKEAYDDALPLEGFAETIGAKLKNNALQSLSWAIDTSDTSKGIPIVVFNPHPYPVKAPVVVNKQTEIITDELGNRVNVQYIFSSTHTCYRRRDTLFMASVPALGYRTYYMPKQSFLTANVSELGRFSYYLKHKFIEAKGSVCAVGDTLENSEVKVVFDVSTGYIKSIHDKRYNRAVTNGFSAVPIVIDESDHDTWSHGKNYFDKVVGEFKAESFEILENGPVRATVKVVSKYEKSTLTQYFSLYDGERYISVRTIVDWQEKHRMLKLKFAVNAISDHVSYEVPFGYIDRPQNGEEEPVHTWMCLKDAYNKGMAILNDSKYSASCKDGAMYLTAVRSPIYGDHGWPRASESPFTDIGIQSFNYAMLPIYNDTVSQITKLAKVFNTPLTNIIENNHSGKLPLVNSLVNVSDSNILVSAIKRSEDDDGYVVRAYETCGKPTFTNINIVGLPPLRKPFTPFACNTYRIKDGELSWEEVLMTEFKK